MSATGTLILQRACVVWVALQGYLEMTIDNVHDLVSFLVHGTFCWCCGGTQLTKPASELAHLGHLGTNPFMTPEPERVGPDHPMLVTMFFKLASAGGHTGTISNSKVHRPPWQHVTSQGWALSTHGDRASHISHCH